MKKEEFFEVLGELDGEIVKGAEIAMKEKTNGRARNVGWIKWGAVAACLCLVIAGVVMWNSGLFGDAPEGGGGGAGGGADTPGGAWPEGVDPIMASVAVIPAEESLLDVADATCVSISEEDAKNVERLGAYLPDTLPDGCRYGTASYYETTMKNGTRYHMIRVTYESGQSTAPAPVTEDGQAVTTAGNTVFLWIVYGHRPDTDRPIYQPDDVTAQVLDQIGGGMFYIDYDGVYVGISRMDISIEDLMTVINSIG